MADLATGIDRGPGKQGGEPCVAGTRVPVRRVGDLVEREGRSPAETAERYDLSVSDVHRALAYYHDHPDEMDRYDRREREAEAGADGTSFETFDAARDRLRNDRD
ncbi:DUF433 domain-containing protein [Halococcus hamelinensis]|uniref:DUF433 domain-containing protein n=1 Tax=Halococcus hamelinensis 100A6 TaxID=1132509 RepID=M0LWW8_9EURY|nr:DUF433 domain-containing protein [Halococcus hamelinensis]EMA36585.1 hypothetical protein C447_15046 [Halococcus hamelinensis 100A6]